MMQRSAAARMTRATRAPRAVDKVYVFCVNDAAVMKAWAKDQGIDDNDKRASTYYVARAESKITLLADTRGELAEALDLVIDHPGPNHVLGRPRLKRFGLHFSPPGLALEYELGGERLFKHLDLELSPNADVEALAEHVIENEPMVSVSRRPHLQCLASCSQPVSVIGGTWRQLST